MLRAAGTGAIAKLLGASAVAASVTGTLTETVLATITIPAGAMGTNGGIRVRSSWSFTNSANTKTLRGRLGGIGGSVLMSPGITTNATFADDRTFRNRGAANSQVASAAPGSVSIGNSTANLATSAENTALETTFVLTGQLANTGETITLESYEVWLLP